MDEWKRVGHHLPNTKIFISPVTTSTKFSTAIETHFDYLNHIGICFHRQLPGHYLPEHQDKYGFYAKNFNVTDLEKIYRAVVFLEDHKPGHFLTVKDKVYSSWKAGDVAEWKGTTPHSAINLGLEPRYTLQITGILC